MADLNRGVGISSRRSGCLAGSVPSIVTQKGNQGTYTLVYPKRRKKYVTLVNDRYIAPSQRLLATQSMKKFVILTYGRTGSTYLSLWLNQHAEVRCHSELFNRSNFDPDSFNYFCRAKPTRRALAFLFKREKLSGSSYNLPLNYLLTSYFQSLYGQAGFPAPWNTMDEKGKLLQYPTSSVTTVGFKLPYDQLYSYRYLETWLAKEDVRIIHLVRHNLLQVALSFASVRHHGFYHTEDVRIREQRTRFPVNPEEIIRTMKQIEQAQAQIDAISRPYRCLTISYEAFFGDQHILTAESIRDFLALSKGDVQQIPKLKKMNADTLVDYVENHEELTHALRIAGYERFIF